MKLILVESPTKARTLSKFLKGKFAVEATMGHIRDLPKAELGVDVAHEFTPKYIVPRDKKQRVNELLASVNKADDVIIATDPDREGEAIAWHVASLINEEHQKSKDKGKKNVKKESKTDKQEDQSVGRFARITFHEITETAINDALAHPGVIDMKLVDAQQARRVLDRLVGYSLSPLLWKKLSRRWLSAGRVQSVTVRLIVEREREIIAFAKEPYWTITGIFAQRAGKGTDQLEAQLIRHGDEKYEKTITLDLFDGKYTTTKTSISNEALVRQIIDDIKPPFTVSSVDRKETRRMPPPAYTTSTLQQDAGRKLYFSSKKTMQLAQKLYEEGLISYHRTDSVNLSEKFIEEARSYIGQRFGKPYVPDSPRLYQTKSKVAQEAHEAIRPTDVTRSVEKLQDAPVGELNHDHMRLYELIWKRAVATQMKEAVFDSTTIIITSANTYVFQTQGSVIKFDGFLVVTGYENGEHVLPSVSVGDTVDRIACTPVVHETQPPPRYSEAGLVKVLEEKDIGRPSTYAPIISTIIDRQYVKKEEKKLVPMELGMLVTDFLVKYFPNIMNLPFTARMEDDLDAIANGTKQWVPVIREFFTPFNEAIQKTLDTAEKVKMEVEAIGEKCPLCGGELVIRTGRYGKFIACSNFPDCKYTRQHVEALDIMCPKCGHPMVMKRTRQGKMFYGCSNYPTCTFGAWKKEDIK